MLLLFDSLYWIFSILQLILSAGMLLVIFLALRLLFIKTFLEIKITFYFLLTKQKTSRIF
jgi:hypothetical protein